MSDPNFDPYHKWLGIPPKDQPANHYRLLGLELFESDRDVIDSASLKQIAYIRTFALGPQSEQSQSLLNEMSAARVTLLDARRKEEYDLRLRTQLQDADAELTDHLPPDSYIARLKAIDTVEEALSQQNYVGALAIINELNPKTIDSELEQLKANAESLYQQVQLLQTKIQQAVANNQHDDLLPVVQQYLTLKADDVYILQLRDQLVARVTQEQAAPPRGHSLDQGSAAVAETRQQQGNAGIVEQSEEIDPGLAAKQRNRRLYIRLGAAIALVYVIMLSVMLYLRAQGIAEDVSEALRRGDYTAALELDPENEQARIMKQNAEDLVDALKQRDYKTALHIDPSNAEALAMKRSADIQQALADGDYASALELEPSNAEALAMKSADVQRAVADGDYASALTLDPSNAEALAMKRSADIQQALADGDYALALQLDPSNADALAMKKLVMKRLADIQQALADGDYTAALQLEPSNADALAMKSADVQRVFADGESGNSIGMKFKLIPAGKFTMGEDDEAHEVTLTKPFMLGTFEVTQAQYQQVMGTNPSSFRGASNPVEMVSWEDAAEFCRRLSELRAEKAAGRVYRLPTEAQWEYACRAGTTTKYSFGDDESDLGDYAWYSNNSSRTTHQVGGKQPNAWGLYDMHGNVFEWCQDWHSSPYPSGAVTDPTGPASGSYRVFRGGSWNGTAGGCRSAYRSRGGPSFRNFSFGFRVVCSVNEPDDRHPLKKASGKGKPGFLQGLLFLEYGRQSSQNGNNGFIDLYKFTDCISEPVVKSGDSFSYREQANAVFFGYLKIDTPGTYTFRAYNFYDRSAIYINGDRVSGYRGSISGGTDDGMPQKSKEKIALQRGYVPFAVIGYVDARGSVNEVKWAPPGNDSFSRIPTDLFFYTDELRREASEREFQFRYQSINFSQSPPSVAGPVPPPANALFDEAKAEEYQEAWAKYLGVEVESGNSIGMKFKLIPAGKFTMGEDDGSNNAKPAHQVTLTKPFMLGTYEVTQSQYQQVMRTNPSEFTGASNPVEKVSWEDAVEFCRRLSELPAEKAAGRVYRLPTEAQWEYACRAGTTTEYSFGDDVSNLGDYAWFRENSSERTHPVGGKQPNAWGLYDMHGNVWEWCQDWPGDYPDRPVTDPTGAASGSRRARRGGSWLRNAGACRSADRSRYSPSFRYSFSGFRVSLSPSGKVAASPPPPVEPDIPTQIELPESGNSIGMKFKLIPAGKFTMGSNDGSDREKPAHQVTLTKPFMLGTYEVTQAQYQQVMGTNPSKVKGASNPVEKVSWEDAVEFCRRLSELRAEKAAGRVYRLPTEAQWAYACRAGTTTKYSFGDDESDLGDYAWFGENSRSTTHPVGGKQPNAWGLHDMHGNVWEWCQDWYGDYPDRAVTDPTGAGTGSSRVYRGGSWFNPAEICRSAYRNRNLPSYRRSYYGFRVSLSPSGK